MNKTDIEWCDYTWNPVTGCMHGCEYCYARGQVQRFGGHWSEEHLRHLGGDGGLHEIEERMYKHTNGKNNHVHAIVAPYPYVFDPTLHRYRLSEPQAIKIPSTVFACSMADLFGDWIPDEWIRTVFEACKAAPWHRYLFLTKNPKRYQIMVGTLSQRFWFGSTITKKQDQCFSSSDVNTFLSIEPLLEDLGQVNLKNVRWVIVGAMTGSGSKKQQPRREWVESIAQECRDNGVPLFMKNSLTYVWGDKLIQEFPEEFGGSKK